MLKFPTQLHYVQDREHVEGQQPKSGSETNVLNSPSSIPHRTVRKVEFGAQANTASRKGYEHVHCPEKVNECVRVPPQVIFLEYTNPINDYHIYL